MNIVCEELGFVPSSKTFPDKSSDQKAYICVYENKIIAMILVERIQSGYRFDPSFKQQQQQHQQGNDLERQPISKRVLASSSSGSTSCNTAIIQQQQSNKTTVEAIIGIKLMWVHAKFRKHGIARHLINTAREKMIYGIIIPINKVAFSSPTQAGMLFANRYCNDDDNNNTSQSYQSKQEHILNDRTSNSILIYDCVESKS
jgi:GNAT superfamily N-acetyltransferase